MGFIVAPIAFVLILAAVLMYMSARRTSRGIDTDATLPDDPAERHDEEVRRLQREHAESGSP